MKETPEISRIPLDFRSDFLRLEVPITNKIVDAISKHHESQVHAVLRLIDNNYESISNREDYFCRHIRLMKVEVMGLREPLIGEEMRREHEDITKQMRTDEYKQDWEEAKKRLPPEIQNKLQAARNKRIRSVSSGS